MNAEKISCKQRSIGVYIILLAGMMFSGLGYALGDALIGLLQLRATALADLPDEIAKHLYTYMLRISFLSALASLVLAACLLFFRAFYLAAALVVCGVFAIVSLVEIILS